MKTSYYCPGAPSSTSKEAAIISSYLSDKSDISSILLVSSATHTRRASMIFKTAFKGLQFPIRITSCPSEFSKFDGYNWWEYKPNRKRILLEYLKILNFYFFEKRDLSDNGRK